ncbi:MAG: hypothetical protein HY718_19910, partial [Planctomycetes bacterium]|nr:hypothetical protein [Planctomycetota bacterium]
MRSDGPRGLKPAALLPLDQVVRAENLAFMTGLPDGCCQLICADPPFFTGRTHVRGNGAQTLADHWPGGLGGYLEFLRPRLRQM